MLLLALQTSPQLRTIWPLLPLSRSVASNITLNLMLPISSQPIPGVVPLDEHGQFSAFAFWLMDKGYTFEEPNTDLHINSFKVCRDVSR